MEVCLLFLPQSGLELRRADTSGHIADIFTKVLAAAKQQYLLRDLFQLPASSSQPWAPPATNSRPN